MENAKEHHGGCHCGRVRFDVTADLASTIWCNCSICQKTGTILAFVPEAQFKLVSGEDDLVDYQFNKNIIHHLFCRVCGVRSFARGVGPGGKPTAAVNVRCLDDVDLAALSPKPFDGKSI